MTINWQAVGAALLPNVGGWLGAIAMGDAVKRSDGKAAWYDTLKKPDWRPPNWAFGPVWTCLYTGMGYASYLVYRDGGGFSGPARLPLILFGTQLALNWIWTPIFFGSRNIQGGLIDISLLTANVIACGIAFYRINPVAGYLFIPYLAWLSVATPLNYCIWRDNPQSSVEIKEIKD